MKIRLLLSIFLISALQACGQSEEVKILSNASVKAEKGRYAFTQLLITDAQKVQKSLSPGVIATGGGAGIAGSGKMRIPVTLTAKWECKEYEKQNLEEYYKLETHFPDDTLAKIIALEQAAVYEGESVNQLPKEFTGYLTYVVNREQLSVYYGVTCVSYRDCEWDLTNKDYLFIDRSGYKKTRHIELLSVKAEPATRREVDGDRYTMADDKARNRLQAESGN